MNPLFIILFIYACSPLIVCLFLYFWLFISVYYNLFFYLFVQTMFGPIFDNILLFSFWMDGWDTKKFFFVSFELLHYEKPQFADICLRLYKIVAYIHVLNACDKSPPVKKKISSTFPYFFQILGEFKGICGGNPGEMIVGEAEALVVDSIYSVHNL